MRADKGLQLRGMRALRAGMDGQGEDASAGGLLPLAGASWIPQSWS